MKYGFFQLLRDQYTTLPPATRDDLTGKTVIVVGANHGIGFEATKHFATMNPGKLILACRSRARGEAALAKIQKETECKTAELWLVDLSSFALVRSFAERYEQEGGRLDILVQNAGVLPGPLMEFDMTEDGWERTLQTNDLSLSLLTILLLPRMLETAEKFNVVPRIVVVSSAVHYWTTLKKELINSPNPLRLFGSKEYWNPAVWQSRYLDSKRILNILFVRALADRLHSKPLIVNTTNPGYCYSGLRASYTGIRAFFDYLRETFLAQTSEQGSRQLLWSALGKKGQEDELRGAYISMSQVTEPSDFVISEEGRLAQEKLWDNLIEELSKVDPKVKNIVDHHLDQPKSTYTYK